MTQIPADFLIAVRSMLRCTDGGELWTFHSAHFSNQQAVDLCLMAEVQAGIPGCYDWRAVDYRPRHLFSLSTEDRASWLRIEPTIKSLCEKHGLRCFSFTSYSKRVAYTMRDRYADCQVSIDTEGRGKSTSYTLSVIFPDMIDKE